VRADGRRWGVLAAVVLLVLSTASSARSGVSVRERICEAAQREGTLHILMHLQEVAEDLEKALKRKFPWLSIRTVADIAAPTRAVAEAQAGRHDHDLFYWSIPGVLPLYERRLLASFSEEETRAFDIPGSGRLLGGAALSVASVVHALAYDSRRIRAEEVPRKWEDLLQERWRGRLVSEITAVTNGIAALGLLFGEAWAFDFTRRLRDEARITLVPSPEIARRMVLFGEKDLHWTVLGAIIQRRERLQEPWGWAPVSPTFAGRFVIAMFARAPHPNAARCAALWLASREGKAALEEVSYSFGDATPGSPTRVRKEIDRMRIRVFLENVEVARRRLELYGRLVPVLTGQVR